MESTSETVSNTITDKTQYNDHDEKVQETVIVRKNIEKVSEDEKEAEETDDDCKLVTKQDNANTETEQIESAPNEHEEEAKEFEESENLNKNLSEETIDNSDDTKTKIINETVIIQETPIGTKNIVTTTNVSKEANPSTTIITTPPTPTTEEKHVEKEKLDAEPLIKREKQQAQNETKAEENIVEKEEEESDYEEEDEDEEQDGVVEKKNDGLEEQAEINKTIINENKKSSEENQVQRPEIQQQQSYSRKDNVVDAPSLTATNTNHLITQNKQDNLNNTLKDIISSIDSNIIAEENIAALKERELELIKKQQELAKEIEQQQLLAQKLASENKLKQRQIKYEFTVENNESIIPQNTNYQPISNVSKYSTYGEKQDDNMYTQRSETFETRESTNVSKKIDLHKIFTPATDVEEILPKNRKLYASSAFYSPTLHPTVEDQVELARRISHSLSDISNQQSRGQSMYVNRKKRSVKWVHEGCGQEFIEKSIKTRSESLNQSENYNEENQDNNIHLDKVSLKHLMNPCGQIRDINSLQESINTETGLLSTDVSAEVMAALHTQKGKGAELFAKRRKVSAKWVVDENNIGAQSPSGLPDYHHNQQQSKPSTSPSILPAYTDAAKHRVQLNLHQEQLLEKYAKPGLKVVQTPWEAALSSGSASTAFVEEQELSPYPASTLNRSPTTQIHDARQPTVLHHQNLPTVPKATSEEDYHRNPTPTGYQIQQAQPERQQYTGTNSQRELAYKPSIPQGWKAPSMALSKDLYMPKEIPIKSYAPPPVTSIPANVLPYSSNKSYEIKPSNKYTTETTKPFIGTNTFPINNTPYQQGFLSTTYGNTQPPRKQYLPPQSYQKIPQNNQNVAQVNFNPSPLPYEKLAKFENTTTDEAHNSSCPSHNYYINGRTNKVRNTSATPFGGLQHRSYTPSSETYNYGGTESISPQAVYSFGRNTPNTNTNITSNQLLNSPTYNSLARGWGSSNGNSGISSGYQVSQNHILPSSKYHITDISGSVPYTDF